MDLSLSSEQADFVVAARDMLNRECPPDLVRSTLTPHGSGHSNELWRVLAGSGWLEMPFEPEYGGAGASLFDVGLAYREVGRALVPTTFSSTITAGLLISRIGTAAQKSRNLTALCEGALLGTVALAEPRVHENFDLVEATATQIDDGWELNGTKAYVPNVETSDVVLVLARVSDPPGVSAGSFGLFLVPRHAPGTTNTPYLTFGQDALSELTLDQCRLPADAILGGDQGMRSWQELGERTLLEARALQCMEMVGGIEAVVDMTVAYVSDRQQFGVPIGSFQAVQHHLANIAMRLEAGRIAAFRGLWAASFAPSATREVITAETWLTDTYVQATLIAHQVWGGMGYALESDLFMWSQRAKTLDLLCGRKADKLEWLLADTGV